MSEKLWKLLLISGFLFTVIACSTISPGPGSPYLKRDKASLYSITNWQLIGRLAVFSPNDSWSANIDWRHNADAEKLKLSGPLGQGAVAVMLSDGEVSIDRGGGRVQTSDQPEEFIQQQLGIFVPLQSLRFWAIGVPEPQRNFQETSSGFVQSGWLVDYREMQNKGAWLLPSKVAISKDRIKLKLVVEQWNLMESHAD